MHRHPEDNRLDSSAFRRRIGVKDRSPCYLLLGLTIVISLLARSAVLAQTTSPSTPEQQKSGNEATGKTPSGSNASGDIEVLSDTEGIDFGPYLSNMVKGVRQNWYGL